MGDQTFTFTTFWPILNDEMTRSQLVVQACSTIDTLARDAGARITGPITWAINGNRLTAEAPAQPLPEPERATRGQVTRHAQLICDLRDQHGHTFRAIGDRLGYQPAAVRAVYHRTNRPQTRTAR